MISKILIQNDALDYSRECREKSMLDIAQEKIKSKRTGEVHDCT